MNGPRRTRHRNPYLVIAADLARHATKRRSWLLLVVIVCALVAAALVAAGQATLPYAIYPAL